jgi:hypothetical protein
MYLFSRFDVGGIGRVDGAGCIGVAEGIVIFGSYFQLFCDFHWDHLAEIFSVG